MILPQSTASSHTCKKSCAENSGKSRCGLHAGSLLTHFTSKMFCNMACCMALPELTVLVPPILSPIWLTLKQYLRGCRFQHMKSQDSHTETVPPQRALYCSLCRQLRSHNKTQMQNTLYRCHHHAGHVCGSLLCQTTRQLLHICGRFCQQIILPYPVVSFPPSCLCGAWHTSQTT